MRKNTYTPGATIVDAGPVRTVSGRGGVTFLAIGALFMIFFILCLTTQVQTNEAFIQGTKSVDVYKPNWAIFVQPIDLLLGHLSVNDAIATIFGWGVEVIYLAFTMVGYELIRNSVYQAGRAVGVVFEIIAVGIVFFNYYADFNYGTIGSGPWGHFWFALLTAFVVGYFGTVGLFLLRHGWGKF